MYATYQRLAVHIWASDVDVIRRARTRLAKRYRKGRAVREQRHAFYREMLAHHHRAQALARSWRF